LTVFLAFGQQSKVERIAMEVEYIENDATLTFEKYDFSKLTGVHTDGGGILKVWHKEKQISKIYEEIGLSYGRIKTTIYLKNDEVIKIIEIEENFPFSKNEIDITKLDKVFRVDIFVFGPDKNIAGLYDYKLIRNGNRVISDGFCELSDFFSTIDRAEKAIIQSQK
jgi:hypothetical protein